MKLFAQMVYNGCSIYPDFRNNIGSIAKMVCTTSVGFNKYNCHFLFGTAIYLIQDRFDKIVKTHIK